MKINVKKTEVMKVCDDEKSRNTNKHRPTDWMITSEGGEP